jgi:alpha-N-arabinofuranosidase
MTQHQLTIDPEFALGDVDRRLFGSFVEHMGRCVYTGIFEPGHPTADDAGLRTDVLALTKELGVSVVRYPGGNFVSGYRWEDGIGPVADRPTRLDLAWQSIEPNTFGLHEFIDWSRKAGVEPMLAVNLGTRGVQEAADLVEYCNHPGGTRLSDLRAANGSPEPFGVKLWCLGNEMDGPWQVGQKTADEYGRLAAETAKAMRLVDPTLQLVACGSSSRGMPTFGRWEAEVLGHAYDQVDYISLHAYYEQENDDLDSFLASAVDMDAFIDEVIATCDHVKAVRRSDKQLKLSFDEWNVWYQKAYQQRPARSWERAPQLIEDTYSVVDAVVVGSYLISLLNHADRVGVACQAQLANIIAPIRTEPGGPAWRQTIFHPFALMARHATGRALRVQPTGPSVHTARFGAVPAVQAAASYDENTGRTAVFLVNRNSSEDHAVRIDLRAGGGLAVLEHQIVSDDDIRATNTAAEPERVTPRQGDAELTDGIVSTTLPAISFSVIVIGPPESPA